MVGALGFHGGGGGLVPLTLFLDNCGGSRRSSSGSSYLQHRSLLFSLYPTSERRGVAQRRRVSPSLRRRSCRVMASESIENAASATDCDVGEGLNMNFPPKPVSVRIPVGDRHILVETGHIGRQASGSVTVTDGETIIYSSACLSDTPSEPADFFPLSVHYQERFSAGGRTSGGFFKREGKAKDHEVLISRMIDRPLRPTMPKGFYHETQILSWVAFYTLLSDLI